MSTDAAADGALTLRDFSRDYRVGLSTVYQEIAAGRIRSYKLGKRRYISRQAARDWQAEREAQAQANEKRAP